MVFRLYRTNTGFPLLILAPKTTVLWESIGKFTLGRCYYQHYSVKKLQSKQISNQYISANKAREEENSPDYDRITQYIYAINITTHITSSIQNNNNNNNNQVSVNFLQK